MHLQVHGKNIDVGAALRSRTEEKLTGAVAKYFDRDANGTVTYTRENQSLRCDCLLHLSSGTELLASGSGSDANLALDIALEHLEKRLRRHMRRLKKHHTEAPAATAAIEAYEAEEEAEENEDDVEGDEPLIVAEVTQEVQTFSVEQAVEAMNRAGSPVLMFRDRGTGRTNVVYRRNDGNIGWIDPPTERGRK
jgi:ribosomal subunit interface protein